MSSRDRWELNVVNYWIFFVVLGAVIIYDIVAALTPIPTLSRTALYVANRHPALPFAFGWLMGHLFTPWKTRHPRLLWVAVLGGVGVIGLDIFISVKELVLPVWEGLKQYPPVSFVLGWPIGMCFVQRTKYVAPEEK